MDLRLEVGQSWWMFQRQDAALEVIAMCTRGGASGWPHVFRITDAAVFIADRVRAELAACGLVRHASPPSDVRAGGS